MRYYYITFLLIIFSCSSENDNPNSNNEEPVNKINNPTSSNLIFPNNNSECTEGELTSDTLMKIEFSWSVSNNTNSYDLVIKNLKNNTTSTYSTNNTSYLVELSRGAPYSWHVISKSNKTDSIAESEEWKFYSFGNEVSNYAPFPPELIYPKTSSEFNSLEVNKIDFIWEATDIDDESLKFSFRLDTLNPPIKVVAENVLQNNFNVPIEISGSYYWQVSAKDENNNISYSRISEFEYTNNTEKNSEKDILSFKVNFENTDYKGKINEDLKTIEIELGNFDYKRLIPEIDFSEKASISPKNLTPQNFLDDLYYTVTAEDGSTKKYDIFVKSGQHEVLSFEVLKDGERYIADVDQAKSQITIKLGDFDYSQVKPIIKVSKAASIAPTSDSQQNFNEELYYTVTSEIGTSKTYQIINPIGLSYVNTFFGRAFSDFSQETLNKDLIVYAGSDLNFSAFNVQSVENTSISLVNENGIFPLEITESFFNNNVYNGSSNASTYIKTVIPYFVPNGTYKFRISDNFKEYNYQHNIQVINDDSTMKITNINQTDFSLGDTIILTGENLTSDFVVKSDGSQYLFNDSLSEISLNSNRTELRIELTYNIYNRLKTWTLSNQKPLAMNKRIDGYDDLLNSNTVYFNIN